MCDVVVEVVVPEDGKDEPTDAIPLLPVLLVGKVNPVRGVEAVEGVGANENPPALIAPKPEGKDEIKKMNVTSKAVMSTVYEY